jgi:hypothetical protein
VSVQCDGGMVARIVAGFAALLLLLSGWAYSPGGTTVISDNSAVMVCRRQTITAGCEEAGVTMTDKRGFFPETPVRRYRKLQAAEATLLHRTGAEC